MDDTAKYQNRLRELLQELEAELRTIGIENPASHDWTAIPESSGVGEADPNVDADSTEDWNERRAVVSELETRYRNLIRALSKIAAGTYGTCEVSGEPIEERRLDANPAARTCIAHLEDEQNLPL